MSTVCTCNKSARISIRLLIIVKIEFIEDCDHTVALF